MSYQADEQKLHFIMFPFMAQGHLIPMLDSAKLLAQHNVVITIFTTPVNAFRIENTIGRATDSGLQIRVILLQFPYEEAGLPKGCESLEMLPSLDLAPNFFAACRMLLLPVEDIFETLIPPPSCIISDILFPWTSEIAFKFNVPRIAMHAISCFSLMCLRNFGFYKVSESVSSELESFLMPGLPDHVEFTKVQLPAYMDKNLEEFGKQVLEEDMVSYGLIVNTFEELEPDYVKEYKKTREGKLWCIGPVSLCNKEKLDIIQRGNKAPIDGHECLKWLDSQETSSVLYVCLGSLYSLIPSQLIELALGLEASNRPFVWVIRGGNKSNDIEEWILEDGFEQRIKGRGYLVRGWAPQVLILSHPAIGGFLTHCGWNSILEAISAGVPMVTWPLFADHFCNEKYVVQILKIGVRIGIEVPPTWGEEENVLVKREDVEKAVDKLMDDGEDNQEGKNRRRRAKELGEMAKRAVEVGGSSQLNIMNLVQDVKQHVFQKSS